MILLLGYFVSLVAAFVLSAAVLSVFLSVTTANKVLPRTLHRSYVAQLSKYEHSKLRSNSRGARATSKDKLTAVLAGAGRLSENAGKEVQKP